mmetsp:Transcript_1035/g.3143  ORF Transcript_1035/g.3143 Transcript_1035/m.3143 type:complete len:177 (+) Transcript_1035:568-1098(+)
MTVGGRGRRTFSGKPRRPPPKPAISLAALPGLGSDDNLAQVWFDHPPLRRRPQRRAPPYPPQQPQQPPPPAQSSPLVLPAQWEDRLPPSPFPQQGAFRPQGQPDRLGLPVQPQQQDWQQQPRQPPRRSPPPRRRGIVDGSRSGGSRILSPGKSHAWHRYGRGVASRTLYNRGADPR